MEQQEFEAVLTETAARLTADVRRSNAHHRPAVFEDFVRQTVQDVLRERGHGAAMDPRVQGFPDIAVGEYGIEVKCTESDSWRCIANSVSEGNAIIDVNRIYVIYGKIGGNPEVRWADYGRSIMHVRTSHVPRFEIEIGTERPLFEQLGTTYEDFRVLSMHDKMPYIRQYARGRLGPGERLWWLEDKEDDDQHSMSLSVKIYMDLPQDEKRKLRAEAALMSPMICAGSRSKRKYNDAVLYMMTYRGVLCPQARDLFSAGSVAGPERGGNYLLRALQDIQGEMRAAAYELEDALFQEYWGHVPAPEDRILEWLRMADAIATDWVPSDNLFFDEQNRIR
ncbi:restriction endonuclease [Paenirhodobacter populi]|uniref:Restriction endonuclease n=1 Tax=Paenirhodobacter populi TaxID=2306993 RepID=A0A443J0J8_9RHOB|nr:restriction endonuclease [Sinirhodobacter populi]RWR13916.1 restriction endonuclease [Sinirhodobacter populi]